MEAKVRRLCERTSTGKIQVTADVHELWLKAGQTRDNLIQLMADSDGNKEEFMRKVEIFKETLRYRDEGTDGGFYSREDMVKKVADGGLGWSANLDCSYCLLCLLSTWTISVLTNKYDDDLEEFWCDKRTSGRQGISEREGLREKTSAAGSTDSLAIAGMKGDLDSTRERQDPGKCEVEAAKPAMELIPQYMKESVAARDKLVKFIGKLDPTDDAVKKELPKLNGIIESLGKHYDELAAMQAESKIGSVSDACFGL
ncbi:unnamed protein product [Symbiodinium sp. CCMP2456]|nr:unnamed protein product [Symbiodinium sp. CCMP2456]